jgi:hypothetical protein
VIRLRQILATACLLFVAVVAASAQTTTFNGIVNDLTSQAVPTGNVTFTLRPGIDTTISGNARFTPTVVTCAIANPSIVSVSGTGTITVTVLTAQNWQIGDALIFRNTADGTLNATSVAAPMIVTGIGGGGTTFTFTLAGSHNLIAAGTVGGLYASGGTGPCVVTQNSAINPAYTSYRVDIQPNSTTTSSFNTYAIGAGPIDISAIVPTPAQQPSYSFVDLFSNGQTISGLKNFTNTGNTYSGGTFTNPIINNATFNTSTATNWTLITPTIQQPTFTTQPITLSATFNYALSWANPAAARSISITDPGGTDSFVWVNAVQTISHKIFDNTNTFQAGATFPAQVYSTPSGSSAANIPLTTMVTPATNATYRFSYYTSETVVGASCTSSTTATPSLKWQDPVAAGTTTAVVGLDVVANGTNGTLGPDYSSGGSLSFPVDEHIMVIRAKVGIPIQYSVAYLIGNTCSPGPQYTIYPILEQLTAN